MRIRSIAAYLNLFVRGDCTEHDLSKVLSAEHPEADAANHTVLFDQSQRAVLPAIQVQNSSLNQA